MNCCKQNTNIWKIARSSLNNTTFGKGRAKSTFKKVQQNLV